MAARLGNVLYWAACAIAAILLLFTGVAVIDNPKSSELPVVLTLFGGGAVLTWLVGRALKYILSGH